MSGKTLGWLVVAVLVIVGGYLFLNQNRGQAPQQTQTLPTEQQPAVEEEEVPAGREEKMEEVTVEYTETGFNPQNLTVSVGAKVTWTNNSGASLQVSSAPHPVHTDFPALNQNSIDDGESVSFVFEEVGTYKYHNHLNASHFGSVTVE